MINVIEELNYQGIATGRLYYRAGDGTLLAEYIPGHTSKSGRVYNPCIYFMHSILTGDRSPVICIASFDPKYKTDCIEILAKHKDAVLSEMSFL